MLGIPNWTSDTWTAIAAVVAFVALIQPWVISTWRRFFRRGTIDIYETGAIEIGFSVGPTIGLVGTLRARNRDMFVQSATLTIVKEGAASGHRFEWVAFRDPKTVVGASAVQSAEVAMQTPSSFMILTSQPYHYNIAFCDSVIGQHVRSILEGYKRSFRTYVDKQTDLDLHAQQLDPNSQRKLLEQWRSTQRRFSDTDEYKNAYNAFEQLFYWEPGTYQLTFQVVAARPDKAFPRVWSFSLLETDVENLRKNVPSVFEEVVGLPLTAGTYLYAYPPYVRNPAGCLKVPLNAL